MYLTHVGESGIQYFGLSTGQGNFNLENEYTVYPKGLSIMSAHDSDRHN